MSIPQIVGVNKGQGLAGTDTITVPLPEGATDYLALAWPGEHHLITGPAGWERVRYWVPGVGAAPLNLYRATTATPGTDWTWGSYNDPEDPEGWGSEVHVGVMVIGLDETVASLDVQDGNAMSYTAPSRIAPAGGALALSVMASDIARATGGFSLDYPSGWTLGREQVSVDTPYSYEGATRWDVFGIAGAEVSGGAASGTSTWALLGGTPDSQEMIATTILVSGPEAETGSRTAAAVAGTTTGGLDDAGSVTVALPAGDSFIAFVSPQNPGVNLTPPSGWTLIGTANNNGVRLSAFSASTGAGTSWTFSDSDSPMNVIIHGFNGSVLLDGFTTGTTATAPSVSPTGASLILYACADLPDGDVDIDYPTSATLGRARRHSYVSAEAYSSALAVAAKEDADGGASGTAAFSVPGQWGPSSITLAAYTESAPLNVGGDTSMALSTAPAAAEIYTPTAGTLEVAGAASMTLSTSSAAVELMTPTAQSFIVGTSANNRYFVDTNGQPVLFRMECNWFIASRDPSVWESYLTTRAAQGYNVIEVAMETGNPVGGDYPDTDNGVPLFDPSDGLAFDLNAEWLAQSRAFVDAAAAHGITILYNIGWGWQNVPGWTGPEDLAQLLHTTFGDAPNIIWGYGVDYPSADWSTNNPVLLSIVAELESLGDTRPKMVQNMPWGKGAPTSSSGLSTDNTDWIGVSDFEFGYAYAAPYDMIRRGYTQNRGPVVLGESNFEQENNEGGPSTTSATLRRQALWTMTCGGVGWDYGHRDIWRPNSGWELALSTPVQAQLTAIQGVFQGIDWWKLAPDIGNTFLTSGQGVKPSSGTQDYSLVDPLESDYATAAVSADGSVGVVFVPTGRSFTVNLGKLGTDRTVRRVDPTNGASTTLSVSSSYTNPGTNAAGGSDWLYVFEAEPFAASGGPAVVVGGVETAGTWTVVQGGVEVPIVSWSVVQGGVEVPLT